MRRARPLGRLGRILVVLSLGACAGLTQQQSDRMKEAQEIANETTKLYGVPHVSVFNYDRLSPNAAAGYAGHQSWILLSRSALDETTFAPVLAHELGHATLRHDYDVELRVARPTMADYWKARQQRELDANARAVEIMVRVMKKTQPEALLMLATYFADANTSRGGPADRSAGRPHASVRSAARSHDSFPRRLESRGRVREGDRQPAFVSLQRHRSGAGPRMSD